MRSARFDDTSTRRLFERLHRQYRVFGPVTGTDGVCRLQPLVDRDALPEPRLPLIPLKKMLLPPRETLWSGDDARCRSPLAEPALALVGIAPCDLHALDYLDRVFAEDSLYQRRRERLLVIGRGCTAGPDCFCPPSSRPPSFDLFLDDKRIWAGSELGVDLLAELSGGAGGGEDLPLPALLTEGTGMPCVEDLEGLFRGSVDWPLWQDEAERCLSCGACSAVCPTCYCYDVVDQALPGSQVTRLREWDNCFFRSHALVAGGQNFRPGRGERLRFRFEHKMLGFGNLRGVSSCVGCGRCKTACPVDIDISEILASLVEENTS